MPKGTIMYHGGMHNVTPEGFEWLAFEPEHAQNFAFSYRPKDRKPPPKPKPDVVDGSIEDTSISIVDEEATESQKNLNSPHTNPVSPNNNGKDDDDDDDDNRTGYVRGYLQTYQATRSLNLLYIDGMAAGNSHLGLQDSEDMVLRQDFTEDWAVHAAHEGQRAKELCEIANEWGYDGVLRMEIGFEVVYCDFQDGGMRRISNLRTFTREDAIGELTQEFVFRWSRAVGERFDGLGGGRVKIDYSSMVSGFMFPINISNTDPDRPDLIRFKAATPAHMLDIKNYVARVFKAPRRFNVDWQAVVDMILSRFSQRLVRMGSEGLSDISFVEEIEGVTLTYYDSPARDDDIDPPDDRWDALSGDEDRRTADAVERCAGFPLLQAEAVRDTWSTEDELIHAALFTVTHDICAALYSVRTLLLSATPGELPPARITPSTSPAFKAARQDSRAIIRTLLETLSWTEWRKTRPCPVEEIEFVAMWPVGAENDHWEPGCRSAEYMYRQGGRENSYWRLKNGTQGIYK